ncbi:MAG TPA: universal stress protein [Stellaceae bacterium]|nr:universal stress protein [Stellaceae bacterium]
MSDPLAPQPALPPSERTFLVVVDETTEMRVALRFAALRAGHTGGRVALLYVIEPSDMQQWMAVESLMRAERREEAEQLLHKLSAEVSELSGSMPVVYIREGRRRDELLTLLDEEPSISILVLAAGTGQEGPGPLITALVGKMAGRMRVPITVVPGGLDDDQIAALA